MLEWFMKLLKRKPASEAQKKFPMPDIVECGICDAKIEPEDLFLHWKTHIVRVEDDPNMVSRDGPLRSTLKQRSMVLIVRRAGTNEALWNRFNPEMTIAKYFANVIISLKQQQPGMRFQYVPVALGDSGVYLRTLLIIAEWDEE